MVENKKSSKHQMSYAGDFEYRLLKFVSEFVTEVVSI